MLEIKIIKSSTDEFMKLMVQFDFVIKVKKLLIMTEIRGSHWWQHSIFNLDLKIDTHLYTMNKNIDILRNCVF
jgi:hypothetical protein